MVICRLDWRSNGDLLEWLATEYPDLLTAAFETAYRLLLNPDLSEQAEADIIQMLRLGLPVRDAVSRTTTPPAGSDGTISYDAPSRATDGNVGGHAGVEKNDQRRNG